MEDGFYREQLVLVLEEAGVDGLHVEIVVEAHPHHAELVDAVLDHLLYLLQSAQQLLGIGLFKEYL